MQKTRQQTTNFLWRKHGSSHRMGFDLRATMTSCVFLGGRLTEFSTQFPDVAHTAAPTSQSKLNGMADVKHCGLPIFGTNVWSFQPKLEARNYFVYFNFFFFFWKSLLPNDPRAWFLLGTCSTCELHPSSNFPLFIGAALLKASSPILFLCIFL